MDADSGCATFNSGLPMPGGTAPELTTPDDAACGSGNLMIAIIGHGHNGALDLLLARCALTCSPAWLRLPDRIG
jgi:hypothetical protein